MTQEIPAKIEAGIVALEKALGVSITVLDRGGFFHGADGEPIFMAERTSHRKNQICRLGFDSRCIEHCRYQVNRQFDCSSRSFIHACWKGVTEMVVPLAYDGKLLGSFFAGVFRSEHPVAFPSDDLRSDFQHFYEDLPVLSSKDAAALLPMLAMFAAGLMATLQAERLTQGPPSNRQQQIERFLHLHAQEPLRLDDVGKLLHLSPSRTSHLIKELFGCSFQNLLLQQRIRQAKILLTSDDLPAAEVAEQTGFCHEYYFSRQFKKKMGMPPGRYRKVFARD